MRPTLLCLLLLFCACQNSEPATETKIEDAPQIPEQGLLLPIDPTGIPMLPIAFADSAQLAPDMALSPWAFFRISTLAARSDDESLNTTVQTALAKIIAEDEAPMETTDLRKVVITSTKKRLRDYKKQAVDTSEIAEFPSSWALDVQYSTKVLHNANGLLTLATQYNGYTGGAHGNYYTVMHNFDLAKGNQLSYEDIFGTEHKAAILALLREEQESEYAELYPTDNIALLRDGILFDYPPYEIASYAEGEIQILVPYAKAAPYLTTTGEVIARRIGGL